jgi:ATP-dependent DNA ligase
MLKKVGGVCKTIVTSTATGLKTTKGQCVKAIEWVDEKIMTAKLNREMMKELDDMAGIMAEEINKFNTVFEIKESIKALDRQKETKLHFFVFDCLAYAYEDFSTKSFSHRFQSKHITPSSLLQMRFPMAEYIHVVENTESDFMEFAEKLWALGAEGIVIVRKEAKYKPGSRTAWDTLKLKKQIGEIDMKVIDVIEPKKNYEGTELESWQYFVDDIPVTKPFYHGWKNGVVVEYQGRIIKVSSGLTDEEREWLATNAAQDAISSGSLYAAITGMEFTEDSLRHPVFLTFKNK